MRISAILFTLLFIANSVLADVRLPKIFGDNMVLQRDQPVVIWGWGSRGEKITVLLNNQTKRSPLAKTANGKLPSIPYRQGARISWW